MIFEALHGGAGPASRNITQGAVQLNLKLDHAVITQAAYALAQSVHDEGWRPTRIIAVVPGGLVPAQLLLHALDLPLEALGVLFDRHHRRLGTVPDYVLAGSWDATDLDGRDVLIVDDLANTGGTLRAARRRLQRLRPQRIHTAVIAVNTTAWTAANRSASTTTVTYHAMELSQPPNFPWHSMQEICHRQESLLSRSEQLVDTPAADASQDGAAVIDSSTQKPPEQRGI